MTEPQAQPPEPIAQATSQPILSSEGWRWPELPENNLMTYSHLRSQQTAESSVLGISRFNICIHQLLDLTIAGALAGLSLFLAGDMLYSALVLQKAIIWWLGALMVLLFGGLAYGAAFLNPCLESLQLSPERLLLKERICWFFQRQRVISRPATGQPLNHAQTQLDSALPDQEGAALTGNELTAEVLRQAAVEFVCVRQAWWQRQTGDAEAPLRLNYLQGTSSQDLGRLLVSDELGEAIAQHLNHWLAGSREKA